MTMKHLLRFFVSTILLASGITLTAAQDSTLSAACSSSKASISTGQTEHTLDYDGLRRAYLLYIPASYDPTQPAPLVLSLHGFSSNPLQQVSISAWNPVADTHGFPVVYPQGTGLPLRWNSGQSFFEGRRGTDDVGFINALLDHLTETLCIDTTRIYVSGLSNGGGMSHGLACELADRVAAIGGVAGAYSTRECEPSRPVPVIAFHGTADNIVPYGGSEGGNMTLPSVEIWAAEWAARNGCADSPQPLERVGAVSGVAYEDCDENASVVFYTVEEGGHTWPGGGLLPAFIVGETNQDVNASEIMWDFFMAHPLVEE